MESGKTGDSAAESERAPLWRWERQLDNSSISTVPISSLLPADSPRLTGESSEHARVLACSEAELPPIVVHRPTMRIIDGMHRLRAAALRGQTDIEVRFYDGDAENAFVLAVAANIAHGLPLSLADRAAAAARIISTHPQWSDRMIASVTGLAAKTVAAVRRRSSAQVPRSNARVGRDGRVRPLSSAAGRMRASELLADNPGASLREISRAAGVAPSTVQDVRNRMSSGEDPVPQRQRVAERLLRQSEHEKSPGRRNSEPVGRTSDVDLVSALRSLRKDPALRFNESGRALLRWLDVHLIGAEEWKQLADHVPAHCTSIIAALARTNAMAWHGFAKQVEQRECSTA